MRLGTQKEQPVMRIQSNESARASLTPAVSPAANQQGHSNSAGSSAAGSPAATVDFSAQAQQIQNAKAAVDATPDVRQSLVDSLKQKVDSGTYKVSSSDIADMMLRRHAADQIK